jgi:hypothetical protein
MVVLARLARLRAKVLTGENIRTYMAHNPSNIKDKIRFVFAGPCGNGPSQSSLIPSIIDMIATTASSCVVVDRGLSFSGGHSEVCLWLQCWQHILTMLELGDSLSSGSRLGSSKH